VCKLRTCHHGRSQGQAVDRVVQRRWQLDCNVIPQILGGTIKVYAIGAPERLPSLPNVSTTGEAGVDFIFRAWNADGGHTTIPTAVSVWQMAMVARLPSQLPIQGAHGAASANPCRGGCGADRFRYRPCVGDRPGGPVLLPSWPQLGICVASFSATSTCGSGATLGVRMAITRFDPPRCAAPAVLFRSGARWFGPSWRS
jgi:hypothetical protein